MKQKISSVPFGFFSMTLALALVVGCAKEEPKTAEPQPVVSTNVSDATISGKIIFKGTPPPMANMAMDAVCGKLHTNIPKMRTYIVGEAGELADVFVSIKEGLEGKSFATVGEPVLLDQVGCEYVPYVIGLQTKQKLLVRNSDPMMHNVHPTPTVSGNKESNKAQMPKSPDYEYTFDNPEVFLTFKCNVHPWMSAYVAVVNHPFFAVSAKDGTFQIKNVPAGKYVVEAYHRKAGKQTKEIVVAADGKAPSLDFSFETPAAP